MSYYAGRQNFTPAAADSAMHINVAAAGGRARLCEFLISSDAAPVEQTGEYQVQRTTAVGTTPAGNSTVVKVDPFSPVALCTFSGGGYTTEPAAGDILMDVSVHQKATFRWVAYPGRELVSLTTANNGISLTVIGQSAAFSINTSCMWLE